MTAASAYDARGYVVRVRTYRGRRVLVSDLGVPAPRENHHALADAQLWTGGKVAALVFPRGAK